MRHNKLVNLGFKVITQQVCRNAIVGAFRSTNSRSKSDYALRNGRCCSKSTWRFNGIRSLRITYTPHVAVRRLTGFLARRRRLDKPNHLIVSAGKWSRIPVFIGLVQYLCVTCELAIRKWCGEKLPIKGCGIHLDPCVHRVRAANVVNYGGGIVHLSRRNNVNNLTRRQRKSRALHHWRSRCAGRGDGNPISIGWMQHASQRKSPGLARLGGIFRRAIRVQHICARRLVQYQRLSCVTRALLMGAACCDANCASNYYASCSRLEEVSTRNVPKQSHDLVQFKVLKTVKQNV